MDNSSQWKYVNPYMYVFFTIFLVLFATFRNGELLPDYSGYLEYFRSNERKYVESSFYVIRSISNFIWYNEPYILFFIYALIGVSIKSFAITRFSPYPYYSLAIWVASFYILHDMIQIRASIASGLLLMALPILQAKKYVFALLLFILSFLFHNSALVFFLLLFLDKERINVKIWSGMYLVAVGINLLNIDYTNIINSFFNLFPADIFGSRLGSYVTREYHLIEERVGVFNPYILLQTLICFGSMIFQEKIKKVMPYAILATKCCFIGVYFYLLDMPGVSMRLAELLSISYIYLVPLIRNWFVPKYTIVSDTLIVIIALALITNFVFLKKFILWNAY